MRYLGSPNNRRVKFFVFIALFCVAPAVLYHVFAYTTLQKKLDHAQNWQRIYGNPPEWCKSADNLDGYPNSNLAVVCGRILSGKQVKDKAGNFMPNLPLPNITVELWEQNPLSPTGKLTGALTNVFSSTSTDKDGRFQITMRKVGPPNHFAYLVFKCGDEAQKPKRIDTWHDYWDLNIQIGCLGADATSYQLPKPPYTFVEAGGFAGCTYKNTDSIATGQEKQEQPTVNDVVESKNFDHRHTINNFKINLGVSFPVPGAGVSFSPYLDFTSPGGWWEPDCLQRDRLSTIGGGALGPGNGEKYKCGIPITNVCNWDSVAWAGNRFGDAGQPGSDEIVCSDSSTVTQWDINDRLTRPFYSWIPKTNKMEPYRRFDIRATLKDYSEEKYLGVAITSRIWGSGVSDPIGNPHVYLRGYMADNVGDLYIDCDELRKRNDPSKVGIGKTPSKNKYLNGGPLAGFAPASDDLVAVYNEVVNCDPSITATNSDQPGFCKLRKPDEYVCNDYRGGRTEMAGNAIRFCEIQPAFGDYAHCKIGEPGCGGPCGASLGHVDYKLSKAYFSTDLMFANTDTIRSNQTNVTNDSLDSHYRNADTLFTLFNNETPNGAREFDDVTQGANGGGVKLRNGEYINGQKANSTVTGESIGDITKYVDSVETLAKPLTSPDTDPVDDYEDLTVWRIWDMGSPTNYCSLGYPYDNRVVQGPLQETINNIQPNNIFANNIHDETPEAPGQLKSKGISSSTFYMSADAQTRDALLMEDRVISIWQMGLGGSVGGVLDTAFVISTARDIFDSVLVMLEGDTRMHDLEIDLRDVITAAQELSNESPTKTFGDRATTNSPMIMPYKVTHPLSEENFAYIPANDPGHLGPGKTQANGTKNGIFVLPPANNADDAALPNGQTQDGEALMPNDWTNTGAAPAACYPFNKVGEGSMCDAFRENPDGISRVCRLDECKVYYLHESGTCTCNSATSCWLSDSGVGLRDRDCRVEDRYQGAYQQKTTKRYVSGEDTEPEEMHIDPYDGTTRRSDWKNEYYPDPRLSDSDCTGMSSYDVIIGGDQSYDIDGGNGPDAPRYNVSLAGPMIGSVDCNGTLEVGDFAIRMENRPPDTGPGLQPYTTLDSSRAASLMLNQSWNAPFQVPKWGGQLSFLTGSHNDRKTGITEGLYTTNAEEETAGYGGNESETAQYSTAPTFGEKSKELEDLYYHCKMGSFTPVIRGQIKTDPYTNPPYDPDMGTVDDNANGLFGDPGDPGDVGWLCPITEVPNPEWVDYSHTSGPCSVGDIGACLANPSVPDNLPQSFFDTVNMAGNLVQTPAAILVAILTSESGFASRGNYWSSDFKIQTWSRPWYGKIDAGGSAQCDDNVWSAQGPYQMLRSTWLGFLKVDAVQQTFNDLANGRIRTASRCNFLDASILAAYHLKQPADGSSGVNPANLGKPGKCGSDYDPAGSLGGYSGGTYNEGNNAFVSGIFASCN